MIINTESGNKYFFTNCDGTVRMMHGITELVLEKMPVITFGKPLVIVGRMCDPTYQHLGEICSITTSPVVSIVS
jgi:hypothetical protein